MQVSRLALVYAKSLIELSVEAQQLDVVYQDIQYLKTLVKASPEFRQLLKSPIISADKKQKIITAIVGANINPLTDKFIQLLIKKNREGDLLEILEGFTDLYNQHNNIKKVVLTTAQPLTKEAEALFIEKLKKEADFENVDLTKKVDANIIGGFVLEYNNTLVDASILRDLKDIKKQFQVNLFESTI